MLLNLIKKLIFKYPFNSLSDPKNKNLVIMSNPSVDLRYLNLIVVSNPRLGLIAMSDPGVLGLAAV
jgi:hypothetical protein